MGRNPRKCNFVKRKSSEDREGEGCGGGAFDMMPKDDILQALHFVN
jgi:hypothetical protein